MPCFLFFISYMVMMCACVCICRVAARENRDRCFVLVGHYNAEESNNTDGADDGRGGGGGSGTIRGIADGVRASLSRFFGDAAPPTIAIGLAAAASAHVQEEDVRMDDVVPPPPPPAASTTIQVRHDENGVPVFVAAPQQPL